MMYVVNDDVTGKRSPMRHKLSRKKLLHFFINISEDQLYESRLKMGEVSL